MLARRIAAKRVWITFLVLLLAAVATKAQPAAQPKLVVRGVVVDDKGKPVAGAIVRGAAVWKYQQGNATGMSGSPTPPCQSDERGAFQVEIKGRKANLTLSLSAGKENAFTAGAQEFRVDTLDKPITLTISPKNACALRVQVRDEDDKPVAGASVGVRHRPSGPPFVVQSAIKPVELPKDVGHVTDRAGRLQTPPCLAPDGSFKLELKAEGFLASATSWKETKAAREITFDVTLRRLRLLEGQIFDRQDKPVAGARVVHSDERQKVETVTDEQGRFQLKSAFVTPGFLFVTQPGFRFHGQRCDRPQPLKIVLTRRDESAVEKMTTLPPALSRTQRKELARRLLEPLLVPVRKADDSQRARALQSLGRLDPGRLLVELDIQPMHEVWFDAYVRREAVQGLKSEAPEEALAVVESMKDTSFRSTAYLDVCDAVSVMKKAEKLALLNQSLLHARAIEQSDHRILQLAAIARRLWTLGGKERATKLLREGQEIARELPTAGWSAYARSAFAEDLALIDLEAALALMKDVKDNFEFIRHHGNLAHKLAATDPAAAERVFGMLLERQDGQAVYQRDQYAPRLCHALAPVDLPRARKIADSVVNPDFKDRCYGVMAQALARSRPAEAREMLDHAFDLLEKQVASGQEHFNNFWAADSLAMLMLPAAEAIDATLVPEFFWRALSLHHPPPADRVEDEWNQSLETGALGALALALARYDHELATVFVEEAVKHPAKENYNRFGHLRAAAIVDPRRAVALVEALPEGQNKDYQRQRVANMLLAEGDAVWKLVHGDLAQWCIGDEDQ